MRKLGTVFGRVGALAISIATVVGCGDNGVVPIDAMPEVDAPDAPMPDPAQLSISPLTSDFGSHVEGTTSPAMSFTVTNTGGSASGSISAQIMGAGSANFSIESNTCTTLDVNATCTVQVSFAPASPGAKTANLVVSGTPGGSVSSSLDGFGIRVGDILLSPGSHAFGNVVVNQTSATAATFTVTNTGGTATGTLTTSIIGADAVDFEVETDTCNATTLAGSGTCSVTVSFTPTSAGAKSASLQVQGTPGGSTTSALTGNGLANARLSINPAIQNFGTVVTGQSSGNQVFTITNIGGVVSGTVNPTLTGTDAGNFTIASGNCAGPLNPNESCNVILQFRPTAPVGAKAAQLAVSATPGGTVNASLLGTAQNEGEISITPGAVTYLPTTVGGTSASQIYTVTNVGGATTGALATALGGNDPAHFQIVNGSNSCQGTSLAAGGICTIAIVFAPTSGGPKSANITVTGTPGGSAVAGLNGDGVPPAVLSINPGSRDFGSVGTGTVTGYQTFTVTNTGGQATGVLDAELNGPQAGQFQWVNGCDNVSLAVGANCIIQVRFAPSINGQAEGVVNVTATPGGSVAAGVFGQGVNPAALVIDPTTPSPISMNSTDTGGQNGNGPGGVTLLGEFTTRTYRLINNGTEPTGVISFTEAGAHTGDYSITHNCPLAAGLPSGMSCTVTITFAPTARGARTASIVAEAVPGGSVSMAVSGNALPRLELIPGPQNPHNFGGHVVNTNAPPSVTVTVRNNTRDAEQLVITSTPTFESTANNGPSPYQFNGGSCFAVAPAAIVLDSDDDCSVNVQFEPDTVGSHPGSVTFAINGGGANNTATQSFTGSGVDSLFFQPGQTTDFGDVAVGRASTSLSFTVTNPPGSPATGPIGTSISSNRFQIIGDGCAGVSLNANASCTIQVRFLPTALGVATADLTISANPGGTTFLPISGTGVSQSTLSFSAAALNFADTYSGESNFVTLAVSNPSNSESAGPLSYALTGADMALYAINPTPAVAGDCNPGRVLLKGESCNLRVRFSPTGTTFGDRSNVTLTVSASPGTPVAGAVFQVNANALSTLSVSNPAATHNFGTLNQGETATQVFTVRNNSAHSVTVTGVLIDPNVADTTVTNNGCTTALTPGNTCPVTVQFSSNTAGVYPRTLRASSVDGIAERGTTATVRTSPVLVWSPSSHDYGSVLAGSPGGTQVYTLTNSGQAQSAALSVAIVDTANFTLTNTGAGSCSTFAAGLPGGASCTVSVQFTPAAGGASTDWSTQLMGMAGATTALATLTGRELAPTSLVLTPVFADLGSDQVGGAATTAVGFTLQNTANVTQNFTIEFTDNQFSQVGGSCTNTLGPNLSCTIQVAFNATSAGIKTAQLRVRAGGVFAVTDPYASLVAEGLDPANVTCVQTTVFPATTALTTQSTSTYTCTNSGDVNSGAIVIGTMTGADPTMFAATGCNAPIGPNLSCTLTVTFTPANVGNKFASFTVSATPGMAVNTINVTAFAVTNATIGISPTAQQTVAARAIGAIDGTAGTLYQVTNGGGVPSGVVTITSSDPSFVLENGPGNSCDVTTPFSTLAAGETCFFVVKFNPVGGTPGQRTATITAAAPAASGGSVSGSITGEATSALTVGGGNPAFGNVPAGGSSAVRTFTFTNNAATATGLLSTAFDGVAEIDFSIVSDDCAGKVLTAFGTPTDSCDIEVQFVPRAGTGGQNNPRRATIEVSGTPGNSALVELSGTATLPL